MKRFFALIQTLIFCFMVPNTFAHEFQNFGVMVPDAGEPRIVHGPGATGEIDTLYMMFNSAHGWFMVALDTTTGSYKQYDSSEKKDIYASSCCVGPDGRIYIGTVGDRGALPNMGGLYVFDPASADKGMEYLGVLCEGEGYFFGLTGAPDGRLYMGSYGTGRLLTYDPTRKKLQDYGNIVEQEKYTMSVAPFSPKYTYVGVGVTRDFIVRVNLETGLQEEVAFPVGHEKDGAVKVYLGKDEKVYCQLKSTNLPCTIEGLQMRLLKNDERAAEGYGLQTISGGAFEYDWDARNIVFNKTDQATKTFKFDYTGAAAHMFKLSKGSDNMILGSSDLPLRLFKFDLTTHSHQNLGNPMPNASGEVYSILPYTDEKIYIGAYPRADLVVYDSTSPWKVIDGKAAPADTNPLSLGLIGSGQNRPYDMLMGPDDHVYIATTANYGEVGGAITKIDPGSNSLTVHRYPIGDHAITALSIITGNKDTIAGGTLAAATGTKLGAFGEAKLFLWDVNQDKVIYMTSPPLEKAHYILQLESTEEGILIGTCGKNYNQISLFAFDPIGREFIYHKDITNDVAGYIWEANSFSEPYQGKMYFTTNNRIFTVDCKNYELNVLAEYEGAFRGAVLAGDREAGNRMACYFTTKTELVAMYLEPQK